mgnify:CR=1 FL=1
MMPAWNRLFRKADRRLLSVSVSLSPRTSNISITTIPSGGSRDGPPPPPPRHLPPRPLLCAGGACPPALGSASNYASLNTHMHSCAGGEEGPASLEAVMRFRGHRVKVRLLPQHPLPPAAAGKDPIAVPGQCEPCLFHVAPSCGSVQNVCVQVKSTATHVSWKAVNQAAGCCVDRRKLARRGGQQRASQAAWSWRVGGAGLWDNGF